MPIPLITGTNDPKNPFDLIFRNQDLNLDTKVILKRSAPTRVAGGVPPDSNAASEIPLFVRQVAPDLVPSINSSGLAQTPPEQGVTIGFRDFSRGAGQEPFEEGTKQYAFGLCNTRWGVALPPYEAVALAGATLDGPVKSWCTHEGVVWFAAGQKVYYLDNFVITEPPNQPGVAGDITKIETFQTDTKSLLIVFYGTHYVGAALNPAFNYRYNDGNGTVAWEDPIGTGPKQGKFTWTTQSAAIANDPSHPILLMATDPNTVYNTTDPTDSDLWNTGAQVGLGGPGNADHFTSLIAAPTGQLLAGKDIHWFRLFGVSDNVQVIYDPLQTDAGLGMENFAWPQILGKEVFAVVRDFDIIRYSNGIIDTGFGPGIGRWRNVREMQKPIASLASNGNDCLYAALSGAEGYVMEGTYGPGREWDWHGAVCSAGEEITFMFVASFPLESDNNLYLFMCSAASPYTIRKVLLPKTDPEFDTNARFTDGWIRTGKMQANRPRDWKTFLSVLPVSRYLGASATLDIAYRIDQATSWTTLVSGISESPEPTDLDPFYAPLNLIGKSVEWKVTLNATTNTQKPTLESLEPRCVVVTQRADHLTAYVEAGTGVKNRRGADINLSLVEVADRLWDCMKSKNPVLITDPDTGKMWTVRIRNIVQTRKVEGFTVVLGNATILQVDMVEIPSISAVNGPTVLDCDKHIHVIVVGDGTDAELEVTLDHVPVITPQVDVDNRSLLEDEVGDNGFAWSGSAVTINNSGVRWQINYHYDPNA